MSVANSLTITGSLMHPEIPLPAWAQAQLHAALWDRDTSPDPAASLATSPVTGDAGAFSFTLNADAQQNLALVGHRAGPQHLVSIGWGSKLEPLLGYAAWPRDASAAPSAPVALGWTGETTLVGYVEQVHYLEHGGLFLAVLEFAGYAAPVTYTRFPPLPVDPTADRHGYHADRRLDDDPEQLLYLLADAESPLAALAQDALLNTLRVTAFASLGPEEGSWHEIVNVPLLLDSLTLFAP